MERLKNLIQRIRQSPQPEPTPAGELNAGQRFEAMAEKFLHSKGLLTVARNYRCRFGEVDLIMLDGEALVFVEVRARKHRQYGEAIETVNYYKQQKIVKTAQHFIASGNLSANQVIRFDVVGIANNALAEITWVSNAFDAGSY